MNGISSQREANPSTALGAQIGVFAKNPAADDAGTLPAGIRTVPHRGPAESGDHASHQITAMPFRPEFRAPGASRSQEFA